MSGDGQECSNIISGILYNHDGPVHEFTLQIPPVFEGGTNEKCLNLKQWLSFLSKNDVRRIKILNFIERMPISSNIFWCSELIHRELYRGTLNPPPYGFNGFPKLLEMFVISKI